MRGAVAEGAKAVAVAAMERRARESFMVQVVALLRYVCEKLWGGFASSLPFFIGEEDENVWLCARRTKDTPLKILSLVLIPMLVISDGYSLDDV